MYLPFPVFFFPSISAASAMISSATHLSWDFRQCVMDLAWFDMRISCFLGRGIAWYLWQSHQRAPHVVSMPMKHYLAQGFLYQTEVKRGLGLILIITPPYLHRSWLLSTYLTASSMTPDMHLHTFTLHLSDASSSELFHPCLSSSKVTIIYKHNNI